MVGRSVRHESKVATAAGVSAGIDLALWLAGEIVGRQQAEAIQLTIEYDPHPTFSAGHMSRASKETQQSAKKMRTIACLAIKIAWRRFIDVIRTGK